MYVLKIKSKRLIKEKTKVYDFSVDGARHYILSNGIVSHNSYVPTKEMSGGSGLKYAASTIIYLTAKKAKDKDNNVTGKYLTARTAKNRFAKEQMKVTVYLDFKRGLHPYYGLQDFGAPLLEKAERGWILEAKKISDKELWVMPWSDELLKAVNMNIEKQFSFGAAGDAELVADIADEADED